MMDLQDGEQVKPIEGYNGMYLISSYGRVWSNYTNMWLSPYLNGDKKTGSLYYTVNLKHQHRVIHRMVAQAFIPNPDNLPVVNHKDENRLNNRVDNLEWCDTAYNNTYGNAKQKALQTKIKNGRYKKVWKCSKETHERLEIFDTLAEAGRSVGKPKGGPNIGMVCHGHKKSIYGYFWEFDE